MTRGNLQVAGRNPLEKRIVTISQPRRTSDSDEAEDSLFLTVLRRRWMLLLACVLASLGVATYMAKQFTMPKAETTGEMRYVSLPPTVLPVYTPPNTLELVDLLRSHEYMSELARRNDLPIDPKRLSELFEIRTSHMSNIISVKLGWGDAQEAIEMVNDLMRIACEKTTANRRETLRNYRRDTEIALASADQRVAEYRDRVLALRRERDQKLREEGTAGSEVQRLTNMLSRVEELLDQAILKKASLSQQISTVRGEEEGLKAQIKQELLRSRRQQVEDRLRALNRSAPQAARLLSLKKALEEFDAENVVLDYVAWQAKLTLLGREILGDLDPVALRVVDTLQRQLAYQTQRAEQLELELLPMDNEISMLESRRESQEQRLNEALSMDTEALPSLEEAETRLEESQLSRRSLQEQLDNIRRLEETDLSELTVLTAASWQTTDYSEGRHKVFVFALAGCLVLLTLPVFALEHFFPSGHPAERAAKSLGIPLVSRGTFVAQQLKHDKVQFHPLNSESLRLLALRIQQSVPGPGSIVVFSGLNHDKSAIPMISYLAECLARREERVLIIDACDRAHDTRNGSNHEDLVKSVLSPSTPPNEDPGTGSSPATDLVARSEPEPAPGLVGLADFLVRRDLSADDMICRTSIPGVDMIPSGSAEFPCEGLASSSLTDLLDECRRRYTMILVSGPSTQQPSDLQMLSARADAILFTMPRNGRANLQAEDTVRDLLDLGAPVIGIVG